MTDNEIIKALECCVQYTITDVRTYKGIPLEVFSQAVLDLINRQKAEIERLKGEVEEKTETIDFLKNQAVGWSIDFCNLKAKFDTAKAEAIKEFAERLKVKKATHYCKCGLSIDTTELINDNIDNLVKEMEQDK